MNLTKIEKACGGKTEEYYYLVEIASRLKSLLGDWLEVNECMALISVLVNHSFRCPDGFVINDERELAKTLGKPEAASIASSFSANGSYDWDWFNSEYGVFDKESEEFDILVKALLLKIRSAFPER